MTRMLQFTTVLFLLLFLFAPVIAQDDMPEVAGGEQGSEQVNSDAVESTESASLEFLNGGTLPTSISQLRAMEEHIAALVERIMPATVNIQVGPAQGSGVVISRDGYILTAAHVIGGPNRPATITFPDGKKVAATTLGINRSVDSGMLKIEAKGRWPYLDIGESELVKDGQWVIAIGHPGGIDLKRGLVLRVGRKTFGTETILNTDCPLVGGDSGGPLIDMDGNVIGIHSRIGGQLTDNLHVPIDAYSREWDQLADGKRIGEKPRPYLGFDILDESNEIEDVTEDSPADNAGLKKGDRIIKIRDREIENRRDIFLEVRRVKPGDKIKIVVQRDDEELTLDLAVGKQ